jgi:hypothetical protein
MKSITSCLTKPILPLLGLCAVLHSAAHAGDVVEQWSKLPLDKPPVSLPYGKNGNLVVISNMTSAGGTVDSGTTPVNPFPEMERALHVTPGEKNVPVRIRIGPFPETLPPKGSFEIQFRLVEGLFDFGMLSSLRPTDDSKPFYLPDSERLFGLRIAVGKNLSTKGFGNLKTEEVSAIESEQNYKLRVEWTTEGDTMNYTFLLNGNPLNSVSGKAFTLSVPVSKFDNALMCFGIFSGSTEEPSGKFFIGSVVAEP